MQWFDKIITKNFFWINAYFVLIGQVNRNGPNEETNIISRIQTVGLGSALAELVASKKSQDFLLVLENPLRFQHSKEETVHKLTKKVVISPTPQFSPIPKMNSQKTAVVQQKPYKFQVSMHGLKW